MECYRHNVQGLLVGTSELVLVLYQLYIDKLQLCRKGKEKFTRLQMAWMETMRDVFHLIKDQSDEERFGIIFYYLPRGSTSLNMTGRLLASTTVYGSPLWLR